MEIPMAAVLCACAPVRAFIGVEFRAERTSVNPGDSVRIGVYAVAQDSPVEPLAAAQVIFSWSPAHLRLTGLSQAGAVNLLASAFPSPDAYGLNEANPPLDGSGMYVAFAPLGHPVGAVPSGTLLTTLLFQAMAPTPGTSIEILARAGDPEGHTTVFDGVVPNRDVTGELGAPVVIAIPAPACLGVLCAVIACPSRRRPL
jgi:hypothetical protein